MKRRNVAALALILGCLGGCQREESQDTQATSAEEARENVGTVPAVPPRTVEEPNPAVVPTTDQPQHPGAGTGPTAGTTPNVSPGKNDAPPPDTTTGGHMAPGGAAAGQNEQAKAEAPLVTEPKRQAEASFKTIKGVELGGEVKLEELASGVRVKVKVEDAPPGKRGVHIHEKGDCTDITGKSMGEHFAPTGSQHGLPGAQERHAGDLGNIIIAQDGSGLLDITVPDVNLKPNDRLSVLGKALVIHQNEDKGKGPAGGSGTPIACAVIEQD